MPESNNETRVTKKEFDQVKDAAETFYKNIGEVFCPYLKSLVSFNAKGLAHIKLKQWNHARNEGDQFTRLRLLHLAPEIIQSSHMLQGLEEGHRLERVKINSRWEQRSCFVQFYEFIAVLQECRVRIIVKKIDASPAYFWSIIPYWKQDGKRRKMFEGNAETD